MDFVQGIIPDTLFSALTAGSVLQALFVALLVGFALQAMGRSGEPILRGVEHLQKLVFKILVMILWLAPIGAFGAIANVVGQTGWAAVTQLLTLMLGFYVTCAVFVFGVLGVLMRVVAGVSIFKLVRYLAREYLLIVSTSSSESALPRLIAKMEHLGVDRSTVGVVVPTGYSFNLDGTAIYLTMASLFIAGALGDPLSVSEQIGLLVFMIVASKGAAGVTGAGLATLAAGLQSHRPDLLDGVGLIVGIDRFMSEARAVTNFSGNAVATVLVGSWTKTIDRNRMDSVLRGDDPFDELTMVDDHTRSVSPRRPNAHQERPDRCPPGRVFLGSARAADGDRHRAADHDRVERVDVVVVVDTEPVDRRERGDGPLIPDVGDHAFAQRGGADAVDVDREALLLQTIDGVLGRIVG